MRVYLIPVDGRNTLLRGPIRGWLKDNRIPAMRSNIHRGWFVRAERVADVVAQLEHSGFKIERRSSL